MSGQEGLLKPWPRSPRRWSHMQGSTAEAQASDWGYVGQRGLMKIRERASQRERRSRIRSLDYLKHYKSVLNHSNLSNHSILLLLERERGGDCKQSFSQEHFCSFLCLFYLILLGYCCPAHDMSAWPRQGQLIKYKQVGGGHGLMHNSMHE